MLNKLMSDKHLPKGWTKHVSTKVIEAQKALNGELSGPSKQAAEPGFPELQQATAIGQPAKHGDQLPNCNGCIEATVLNGPLVQGVPGGICNNPQP